MFKQYAEIERQHPGSVVLFRIGDFLEAFGESAEKLATACHLSRTVRRDIRTGECLTMCGFPYHSEQRYIPQVVAAGHRVLVCEQSDGKPAAPVERVVC